MTKEEFMRKNGKCSYNIYWDDKMSKNKWLES